MPNQAAIQPTFRTVTLGCKVNQYETQYVREGLELAGYREAEEGEAANLCLVNTCTVTSEGDAKSRQTIRQLAVRNPQTRIIVMGCYATRAPDEVARLPGVVEVVRDKRELPDLVGRFGVADVPTGISRFDCRKRAYVKVQDGCLLRCSFCIIPHVRPTLASRPADEIVAEVRRLLASGYREIILTGIHLGHYGVDFNAGRPKRDWLRLSHLIERLVRLDGEFRIRLSSIEATEVTRELIDVLAANPARVCPHLHVSLQSGSDRILRAMRRRWCSRRFIDRCLLAAEKLDRPAFTSDVIVGFPGETEADFDDTCRVVEEVGFSKLHVFSFSPRRGTPAAELPNQIAKHVKQERSRRLGELEQELLERYARSLFGRRLQVMVESPIAQRPGMAYGTSCRYVHAAVPAASEDYGKFREVIPSRFIDGRLEA